MQCVCVCHLISAGTGHQVRGIGTGGGGFRTVIIVKVDLPFLGMLEGRTDAWKGYSEKVAA